MKRNIIAILCTAFLFMGCDENIHLRQEEIINLKKYCQGKSKPGEVYQLVSGTVIQSGINQVEAIDCFSNECKQPAFFYFILTDSKNRQSSDKFSVGTNMEEYDSLKKKKPYMKKNHSYFLCALQVKGYAHHEINRGFILQDVNDIWEIKS